MKRRQYNTVLRIIKQSSAEEELLSFAEQFFHDDDKLFTELWLSMETVVEDTSKEVNGSAK